MALAISVTSLALGAPIVALAANPGSATTPSGQVLNIKIDAPANGATVPFSDLDVKGTATLTSLTANANNVAYILDNSGSTSSPIQDCTGDGAVNASDDANGDGNAGDVLDCEISGIAALNSSLLGRPLQAAVIAFGSDADGGDVSPAAGQQDFAGVGDDASGNARPDVEDVARTVTGSGVGQFTPLSNSGGGTNFDAALTKMNADFAQKGGQANVAFFLSDGQASVDTSPGGPLDQARAAGTRVSTYSVGTGAAGCAAGSGLKTIADTTGGNCVEVTDPSKLTATISGGGGGASVKGVSVAANGGAAVTARNGGGPAAVPAAFSNGNYTVKIPASRLRAGSNQIVATATATDGTTASADVTVNIVAGRLTPSTVFSLPSSRKCVSRRLFPIRIRRVKGYLYDFATVFLNGKKVRVYVRRSRKWIRTGRPRGKILNVKSFRAYVDLRGFVKGRYKVRIVVVTTNGRIVTGNRKYRTCTRKLRGSVPKL